MEGADLWWLYVAGVVVFLLIADEPWPERLGLACLWPLGMLILLLVLAVLILTAAVVWWPVGLLLAAVAGLVTWGWCG